MTAPAVFISYSHDSDEHRELVLRLSERLRADGIETVLDQYVNGSPPEGWPRWMLDQLEAASHVLVVCTETYYRRFRGKEEPGKGKGVDWEGALITQEIYNARGKTSKFVPIFMSSAVDSWIPEPLRAGTHYALTSQDAYQRLYDFLLGQGGVKPQPLGTLKARARRAGAALTFDEPAVSAGATVDISRIVDYAPAELIGREAETRILSDAWDKIRKNESPRARVLAFVALGGEGKTSLVAKWAADLAERDWPGCDAVFAWSFYRQGTDEKTADSSDLFLTEALEFFGDSAMSGSSRPAIDKGRRLAQLVGKRRTLLILDGLEPLQEGPASPAPYELKDQGLVALLNGLAAENCGLCVVTTRYSIPNLRAYRRTLVSEVELKSLSPAAGVKLLRLFEVKGRQEELQALVEDVKGHALTLNLLGTYLRDAHAGDIRKRNEVRLEDAAEEHGGHAFRVMDAYVKSFEKSGEKGERVLAFLRLLGLFDRPASADCLTALLQPPAIATLTSTLAGMDEAQCNLTMSRLASAKLLTVNRDRTGRLLSVDCHPLIREYLSRHLRAEREVAWYAAHRRLFEHLSSGCEGDGPSLEALQPLYQAVSHGCRAGMYEEAWMLFEQRIQQGTLYYSTRKLGAFGLSLSTLRRFSDVESKGRLSPAIRGSVDHQSGICLRSLGRLEDAVRSLQQSIDSVARMGEAVSSRELAVRFRNLGQTCLCLGNLREADNYSQKSIEIAAGEELLKERCNCLTRRAELLHAQGRTAEARQHYDEAARIWRGIYPTTRGLVGYSAFLSCECLLDEGEFEEVKRCFPDILVDDQEERNRPVMEGLQLTVRARLAEARPEDQLLLGECSRFAEQSIPQLRLASEVIQLARGLLVRAWLRGRLGACTGPDSAQTDLDEAWDIAERGQMRLYMADIHLRRAQLFFRELDYPWGSVESDLAEARKLIKECGYGRRSKELDVAEARVLRGERPTN